MNDSQKSAVISDARACLLLAGPGSGKTHTITARIRYLIHCRGVPPEKILVITFTKDAALSMQRRFCESERSVYPVVFGTFHSVFYSILRESKGYSSKKLLSDSYKKSVFSKIISEIIPEKGLKKKTSAPAEMIPEFISAVSFYKNTCDRAGSLNLLESDHRAYFDMVFKRYEEYRKDEKLIDFDDMVYDCINLLNENEDVRNYWRSRFDHILIDEYQDINQRQFETVSLLHREEGYMFAVGDDDQSIYGFRGSKPACLKLFTENFGARVFNLDINYRSGQNIIDSASKIIGENKDRFEKSQKSYNSLSDENYTGGEVIIKSFKEKELQYGEIANELLKGDVTKGVLFRTNLGMQKFASFLTEKGIEYHIRDKSLCVYDHPAAVDLLAYLNAINKDSLEDLYKIINKPLRYIAREALGNSGIDAAIRYYLMADDKYKALERVRSLRKLKRDFGFIKGKGLYLQIGYIRKKIGLDKYYLDILKNKQIYEEYIAVLDHISQDGKEFEDLDEWHSYIEVYREDFLKNQKKKITRKNMPQLMTIHASKGLEFDEVYIPDVNEGVYPHGKMLDRNAAEEERRVFYVGVTRAKEKLFISYLKNEEGSGSFLPSRFLNPLIGDPK